MLKSFIERAVFGPPFLFAAHHLPFAPPCGTGAAWASKKPKAQKLYERAVFGPPFLFAAIISRLCRLAAGGALGFGKLNPLLTPQDRLVLRADTVFSCRLETVLLFAHPLPGFEQDYTTA
jgi:hypothetical protein